MPFTVLFNRPGYLPEADPTTHPTFPEARQALIDVLLQHADELDSDELAAAAEDVNLWNTPDHLMAAGYNYEIQETPA